MKFQTLNEYFDYVKKSRRESKYYLEHFVGPLKRHCEECGSKINLHIHHKKYPALSLKNIEILCGRCHVMKHAAERYITKIRSIIKIDEQ